MAEIVCGIAMSHSPLIMTNREAAGAKGERFLQAADDMNKWLEQQQVDAMILISDDHFRSYYYDHMPTFTVCVGECVGWGDWNLPQYEIPVQKELANHLLNAGLDKGFDFAFSMSAKVDHGHTQGIYFLNTDLKIPVVPVAINTTAPPLPTMERCYQLGKLIREAVESWDSSKRVAIVASGGLSHWVPIPKLDSEKEEDQYMKHIMLHGRSSIQDGDQYTKIRESRVTKIQSGDVNEEWDRFLLEQILRGDPSHLRKMTAEEIEKNGGNGGQEIRNWMAAIGALEGMPAEIVYYEPIHEWVTGMAITRFKS